MRNTGKCYLCHRGKVIKAFDKLGWTILQCQSCKLYSLNFKGSYRKFIKTYYDRKFFTGSNKRAGYYNYEGDHRAELRNMRTYLKGIKHFKDRGKLLDVGCATGLFLLEARKNGFAVHGLDVSDYAVAIAKKRFGKLVKKSTVEAVVYPEKNFDIITMFDVIEHLIDPRKVLIKLSKILKDDSLLVINTGDTDSLLAKIQGDDWHFFIPPQHFYYFSQRNITTLLNQAGFRVKKVERNGKWVSLRYLFHLARQIQNDVLGQLGFALVANNALGKIPIYLNLFDNITIYAVKKTN